MKKFCCSLSVVSSFFVLSLGWFNFLYADSGRAPISGTPMLREQRLQLLRDYGPANKIQAELGPAGTIRADIIGQQVQFWALDFGTNQYYQTGATCRNITQLSSGFSLFIYVEDTEFSRDPGRYSSSTLSGISNQYVNTVLPTETLWFGAPSTGNFTILLMDIKDSGGTTFVSGYFDPRNEINTSNSNFSHHQHMIYMDSKDGDPTSTTFFGTFAHEFNHFIQFNYDPNEETWVEEGMAGLARYVCGYGPQASHVSAFSTAPTTSLTSWVDDLAHYGATFLFMLYLEEHNGGANTTKAIVANTGTGIAGINSAFFSRGFPTNVNVNEIMKSWVVANYLNNLSLSGGIYGYQANFSAAGITNAPGNIQVTSTVSTYPASGSGTTNQYAGDYVKFANLGGTYDIFVLIPYSLSESGTQSYSYTGRLGSFLLNITGISSTQGMTGVKQGSSSPNPAVVTNLSSSNSIDTSSGGSSGGGGGDDGGGGCFIATAAYGSPRGEEVMILRKFRDQYLQTHLPGRLFVSAYYKVSPPLAHFIEKHEDLKALTRGILYPIVGLADWFLKTPGEAGFLSAGAFILIGLLLIKRREE